MAFDLEILRTGQESKSGTAMLDALHNAARMLSIPVTLTQAYRGRSQWLALFGVGARDRSQARDNQVRSGRHALCWDLGYFGRTKVTGHLRVAIDHHHPQGWLSRTPPKPERWEAQGIALREDADPAGHIVLVGLGPKSHTFLGTHGWEKRKYDELRIRFPKRRIVYRPKPNRPALNLGCEVNQHAPIGEVLRGASLVVCRHSNVAVDAVIAGVPIECEDGAAEWLTGQPYTRETRLDFLRRLSWWQWMPSEAVPFLKFLQEVTK